MSVTQPAPGPAHGYRPWLDGVRAVAVLLVLAQHVCEVGGLAGVPALGAVGVGMFFGLSGYLITGLLLDERARTGRVDLRAFYLRRAARLLPALLLMLAVSCGVFVALGHPQVLRDAFFTVLYLANYVTIHRGDYLMAFGQTWSLAIEEHFYLTWPLVLVLLLLRRRSLRSVVVGVLVVCALVLAWRVALLGLPAPTLLVYHGSVERLDALLYGCAAALAVRTGWRPPRWLAWAGAGLLALAAVVHLGVALDATLVQAAVGAASAALVVGLDHRDSRLRRALSWRPAVAAGRVSYGIYLWHWFLLVVVVYVDDFHRDFGVSVLMGFVVTPLVAAASYRWLEHPVRARVGRRLASRQQLLAGGAVAPAPDQRPTRR